MAQTVTPPTDAPRPLPRRPASPQGPRAVRPPRLVPLDALWMLLLAVVAVVVTALLPSPVHAPWLGAALAAGTVVLLYLLGWRARDRAAGVVGGLLAATSAAFLHHAAIAPLDAAFALLTVAALFSFVAGSSLVGLAFAGLAAVARPDGLLLGVILLGLALAQRRRRAAMGALAFVLLAGGGWAARIGLGHGGLPDLILDAKPWLPLWAVTGGMVFVSWLLLPWLAELGEAPRRARWLPVALWVLAYAVIESFVRVGGREATVFGLMPLWFALAGGGLSRLLPALTGDVPLPWVRYGLATLAVLALVAMRGRAEWPLTHAPATPSRPVYAAPVIVPPPAQKPAVTAPKAAPTVPTPHTAVSKPVAKASPPQTTKTTTKAAVKAAPKAAVKAVPKTASRPASRPLYRYNRYRRYRPVARWRYARHFRR